MLQQLEQKQKFFTKEPFSQNFWNLDIDSFHDNFSNNFIGKHWQLDRRVTQTALELILQFSVNFRKTGQIDQI